MAFENFTWWSLRAASMTGVEPSRLLAWGSAPISTSCSAVCGTKRYRTNEIRAHRRKKKDACTAEHFRPLGLRCSGAKLQFQPSFKPSAHNTVKILWVSGVCCALADETTPFDVFVVFSASPACARSSRRRAEHFFHCLCRSSNSHHGHTMQWL